jgi:hypothetical protein
VRIAKGTFIKAFHPHPNPPYSGGQNSEVREPEKNFSPIEQALSCEEIENFKYPGLHPLIIKKLSNSISQTNIPLQARLVAHIILCDRVINKPI